MITALALALVALQPAHRPAEADIETRVSRLLGQMTLEEKLDQMSLAGVPGENDNAVYGELERGRFGGLYGFTSPEHRAKLQQAALKSRLHIPLIFGADVIHGCVTGLPIPLGQAASFDPALVQQCARISGAEAASQGIHWVYSPMMDIARDPRWGRIAEGYGEDPYLASVMAVATVRGYQGPSLSDPDSVAACGKHYVGYGAAEAGRDYNTTWIPENLLRDVYLKPYQASVAAGIGSLMSAFNAINGVPASGNTLTLHKILRDEWKFPGMVVSDYESVDEMIAHGYAADGADAALKGITAGVDMEMVSQDYARYGAELVRDHKLDTKLVDECVRNILRLKFRLGLFDGRPQPKLSRVARTIDSDRTFRRGRATTNPTAQSLELSKRLAAESLILLKNKGHLLPLSSSVGKVAVVGSLADNRNDQLGCWATADPSSCVTPLAALRARLGSTRVLYSPGISFDWKQGMDWDAFLSSMITGHDRSGFEEALRVAGQANVVLLFIGEPSALTGEASSRTSIDLPGVQAELVAEIAKLGKPMVGIISSGRPLTMQDTIDRLDSVLFSFNGGSMAGPAIVDTLFGDTVPSGKLPVTFPRSLGQVPIYYDHLSTGRPVIPGAFDHFTSRYLDSPDDPAFPFGFGLSYTDFKYSPTRVSTDGRSVRVSGDVTNTGTVTADEIVQLYSHQRAASVARPVRELKGFKRVHLAPGESQTVTFDLNRNDLAFCGMDMHDRFEPGSFDFWVAPDSVSGVAATIELGP